MPLAKTIVHRRTTNRKKYSLTLKNTAARNFGFIQSLNGIAYKYRKRTRLNGGDWTASFMVGGNESYLKRFFLTKIGHHLEQTIGNTNVWEGFIYEMDLTLHGITRRISMADVRNAVKAKYTDSGGNNQSTGWYTDNNSIRTFGRIEEIIYIDGVNAATAQAEAQTHLQKHAFPTPEVVSVRDNQDLELEVTAAGYVFTMNNKYVTAGNGTDQNLSVFLKDIIDTDCEFVTAGRIEANTTQVRTTFDTDMRAWDAMVALTEIGDATQPFVVQVFNGRRAIYKALSPNPTLYWRGRTLHTRAGTNRTVNPWMARPGILRDLTWERQPLSSSAFLLDSADSIISEIEIAEGYDVPLLKTDVYDDSDFMTALAREIRADETRIPGDYSTKGNAFI